MILRIFPTYIIYTFILSALWTVVPAYAQETNTTAPVRSVTPTAYQDLPSYSYDPAFDTAHPPYKTPIAHDLPPDAKGKSIGMGTISGVEIGVQASYYDYQSNANLSGPTAGIILDAATTLDSGWFFAGEFHGGYGFFNGTGKNNWLWDIHGLVGHDFIFQEWAKGNYDISPYIGIGDHHVYNDLDEFIYLPLGITQNIRVDRISRLSINTEFDFALESSNIYGLRGNVLYQWSSWSIGPFFEYWRLNPDTSSNDTFELGGQLRYRF